MNKLKFHKDILNSASILSKQKNYYILTTNNEKRLKNELNLKKIPYFYHKFINSFTIFTDFKNLSELSNLSSVNKIMNDTCVSTLIDKAKKFINIENLTEKKYNGENITIAFIDTGISPHIDFITPINRIKKFVDLVNKKTEPYDDNGHGTFVAGIACSSGLCSGRKYRAIASKSQIVMIKAIEANGIASSSKILQAMEYIYDNAENLDIKVVCMSFGAESMGNFDPLVKGVKALWEKGITIVCAAGNSGPQKSSIKSPATYYKVISVGSIDDGRKESLKVADFSSRGPAFDHFKPDLVVPGVELHSTYHTKLYTTLSGTSVSTPIVASIVAIMLQKDKTLSPDRVKFGLIKNCHPISRNRNEEGSGYLQFWKF